MQGHNDSCAEALTRFRPYLKLLARLQLYEPNRARLDSSDVVQQTLVEAHAKWDDFRGSGDAQLRIWLGQILANNVADAVRREQRQKRDYRRERRLDDTVSRCDGRLCSVLEAMQTTPTQRAERNEQLLQLAAAMEGLPDSQRQAVDLFYLLEWSLADVANRMQRTEAAVAGLLHRGLKKLRELMQDWG